MKKYSSLFLLNLLLSSSILAQSAGQWIMQGNENFKKGAFAAAEDNYQHAIEKAPQLFSANFNAALSLYRQGNYPDAASRFEFSLSLTNDTTEKALVWYHVGNALLMQNKFAESIKAYKNALRLNPADKNTRYNLAYAQKKYRPPLPPPPNTPPPPPPPDEINDFIASPGINPAKRNVLSKQEAEKLLKFIKEKERQ